MNNPHKVTESTIFKKLLEDAPHIEADFKAFKQEYRELLEQDYATKALILQSHLVVEYYLTQYLEAANPASPKIGDARLTFAQKLEIADHPQANFHFLIDGIRALNSMRNRIAHRLDFVPSEQDFQALSESVKVWNTAAGKPIPKGLNLLEVFTETVCSFLHADTQAIKRHAKGAGLIGLLDWWRRENT